MADLMDSKGNIWSGKSKVMQGTNKAAIGMYISKRLTTGGGETHIGNTGGFTRTAVNHIVLCEEISGILRLSNSKACGGPLNLQTKEVAEGAHVFKLKDLTEINNELVQK